MLLNDQCFLCSERARIALSYLNEQQLRRVNESLKVIKEQNFRGKNVSKLKDVKNTLMIKVGRDLRLIIEVNKDSVFLHDIFSREKLDALLSLKSGRRE